MRKRLAAIALALMLVVTTSFGQIFWPMPVFDAANLAQAVETLSQLYLEYEQLVETYKQIVLEYKHMLWMARTLPGLIRYSFTPAEWRFSSSSNTYGMTGAWTSAVNSGIAAAAGYARAVERLNSYGGGLGSIPADQIDRALTGYATVELADAANIHGIEVLGLQRAKARTNTAEIDALEQVSVDDSDEVSTQIAVLNKINAASVMSLRSAQDTNQLLVSVLEQQVTESKARRDAETAALNADIACRLYSRDAAMPGIRDTTQAITSFRMP